MHVLGIDLGKLSFDVTLLLTTDAAHHHARASNPLTSNARSRTILSRNDTRSDL